ncbi:MAG: type II restriction endonuclease [Candidatus Omnitrophota bacterium]
MSKKQDLISLGSRTARNGFRNEDDIVKKFHSWKSDADSQTWLVIMGYALKQIEKVEACKLHGFKTDVQIKITIYMKEGVAAENLSIKLVSNPAGFNQVDKRWVDQYALLWDIPPEVIEALKLFTGEIAPLPGRQLRDGRRMFFDELDAEAQRKVVSFFTQNKILVVSDILRGRGPFSAGWMLVALKADSKSKWELKSINQAMNVFAAGDVEISPRGSLKIGKIGMQRKGGDGGRRTAQMLQFKINPVELFGD